MPGIANRLKCRGQIVESSRVVTYEVTIKERGYRPEPYAIADALILADGKPIVEVTDMALQLSGNQPSGAGAALGRCRVGTNRQTAAADCRSDASRTAGGRRRRVLFDHDRILAFAIGKPSDAFGERYRVFDQGRFIARLPGPPYQFLDRITRIEAEPWVMAAGGSAEAEFDVVPDAWYFAADRQDRMPFAVLLEVALQACGWMAAYMGSALTSDDDLKFRNLGGTGRQHRPVTRHTGTLTTRVRVTKISSTAGMILQHYEFAVDCRDGLVYDGSAEFGFFHPRALDAASRHPRRGALRVERGGARRRRIVRVSRRMPPFPDSRWRMIDQVDALVLDGGPHGLGVVRGSTRVDPDGLVFQGAFPRRPGLAGIVGVGIVAATVENRGGEALGCRSVGGLRVAGARPGHRWTYRGQIVPRTSA